MPRFVGSRELRRSTLLFAFFASAAAALDTDCVENGGKAVCTAPIIVPVSPAVAADSANWSYTLCDEEPPYLRAGATWCVVKGGTWVTSDPRGPYCVNVQPVFDPVVYPWSREFERQYYAVCTINGTDSGWDASVTSAYCWSGTTTYKNGIAISQLRAMAFSGINGITCNSPWAQRVIARRARNLACPQGFTSRQKPNAPVGDIECFYLPPCCESVGNPINPAQGNKTLVEVDFRSPKVDGLTVVRYYNNAGFYRGTPSGTPSTPTAADFWRTSYDRRLFPIANRPSTIASVQREDGSVQYFSPTGQELHNISGGANRLDKLVDAGGTTVGWRYTTASKDVELYDAAGALQSIALHTGMMHTLAYSNASTPPAVAPYPGLLIGVTDSLGRAISFTYDAQGRRATLVDPLGQQYVYSYDGVGNLWKVTYPDLTTRTYVYGEAVNNCSGGGGCSYALMRWTLTGIVDENGKRYATYVYNSTGRAVRSVHAGGADGVGVAYSTNKATITDALGTIRTTTYQDVSGVIKTAVIAQPCVTPGCAGTVTRTFTYDNYGNVASQTDFNNKKTCYAYDTTRNLETARVEGVRAELCSTVLTTLPARPDVRKVSTQWHAYWRLPAKVAEPNRITTFVYHGDIAGPPPGHPVRCAPSGIGVLCSKTVQETADPTGQQGLDAALTGTPRTWRYTYDSLGQVLTATDPNGRVATTAYYAANDPDLGKRGNVQTITNPVGHVTAITDYDLSGRPLSITDPNGVVTTLTYWPRGWLDTRTVADETTSYDYDLAGQLAKVTQPDGSYVQYTYDDAHRLTDITDGLGNRIHYTLDAMGNRTSEQAYEPGGYPSTPVHLKRRVYDSLNRLHQSVGAQ